MEWCLPERPVSTLRIGSRSTMTLSVYDERMKRKKKKKTFVSAWSVFVLKLTSQYCIGSYDQAEEWFIRAFSHADLPTFHAETWKNIALCLQTVEPYYGLHHDKTDFFWCLILNGFIWELWLTLLFRELPCTVCTSYSPNRFRQLPRHALIASTVPVSTNLRIGMPPLH